jgi:capsular exopolysaccharide synthesis family protein
LAKEKSKISISDLYDAEAPEASEFRRLLHNLNNVLSENDKRAILVTSAMGSEGKSIISSYLAMTSSRHKNKKTLLVDFDLRRPTIHKLFSMPRDGGLSDVLLNGQSARKMIKNSSLENLDILTAGKAIPNPSDIINGPAIHKIIEEMKFYYELIVLDSSPMIPVSDPLLILEEVDGVVIVVKAGATPRGVIRRACDLLIPYKKKVMGVVVNNLTHSLPYYYNYNYYGYQYKPTKE